MDMDDFKDMTTAEMARYVGTHFPNISNAYDITERNRRNMIEKGPLEDVNIYPLFLHDFIPSIKQLNERFGQRKVLEELWEDIHKYLCTFPDLFKGTMDLFENELWMSIMGTNEPLIIENYHF